VPDIVICVEASEIELKPGCWPYSVTFEGIRYEHRPGMTLKKDSEGDIQWVEYQASDGRKLRVFND